MADIDQKKLVAKKREYSEKGITLKNNRRADKIFLTVQGPLTISRTILIPADEDSAKKLAEIRHDDEEAAEPNNRIKGGDNGRNITRVVPLDEALGIDRLPFKMSVQLMLRCAYWAQNQCSYQAAEETILDVMKLKINDDTIRKVTNTIGKIIFENDCREAEPAWKKLNDCKLRFPYSKQGVLGETRCAVHRNGWRSLKHKTR